MQYTVIHKSYASLLAQARHRNWTLKRGVLTAIHLHLLTTMLTTTCQARQLRIVRSSPYQSISIPRSSIRFTYCTSSQQSPQVKHKEINNITRSRPQPPQYTEVPKGQTKEHKAERSVIPIRSIGLERIRNVGEIELRHWIKFLFSS